jgi:hypothetical protein
MNPLHGEIWLADMGIAGKTRPVVVMLAEDLPVERTLIIYVPVTRQARGGLLEVPLGHCRAWIGNRSPTPKPSVRFLVSALRDGWESSPRLIWPKSSKPSN